MANDTISATPNTTGSQSKALHLLSKIRWYELIAVPVIAIAAAIFWFKDALMEAFLEAEERTALMFGAGMVPLAIWVGFFFAALVFKPGLFRHYRLWIASLLLLALTLGVLALFRPLEGDLSWFTLGGYVSLGGIVGEFIAGPVLWQQVLRLGALAIVAVIIISPTLAALFATKTGRLFTFAYFGLIAAANAIGGMFHRKKRDPDELTEETEDLPSVYEALTDHAPTTAGFGFSEKDAYPRPAAVPIYNDRRTLQHRFDDALL